MREVVLSIYHNDCWGPKTSGKFPEVNIALKTYSVAHTKKEETILSAIWEFASEKKADVDQAVRYVRGLKETIALEELERIGSRLRVFAKFKTTNEPPIIDILLSHGCHVTDPVRLYDGLEHWGLMVEDKCDVRELVSELNGVGQVRVRKVAPVELKTEEPYVTERQISALKVALENGYYNLPRPTPIADMASILGVSKPSFLAHLRKAEGRVLPLAIVQLGLGEVVKRPEIKDQLIFR